MDDQKSAYEIFDYLEKRFTLDHLYKEGSEHCVGTEIASTIFTMDKKLRNEVDKQIGAAVFDREAAKYGCDGKRNNVREFPTELPTALFVKKMLGRDKAAGYRALLERAETLGVAMNILSPYKLVNKRRMEIIIGELSDYIDECNI